eukprot:scaffold879_cov410-Prasinococcus_capsulatus_cf.AAC.20
MTYSLVFPHAGSIRRSSRATQRFRLEVDYRCRESPCSKPQPASVLRVALSRLRASTGDVRAARAHDRRATALPDALVLGGTIAAGHQEARRLMPPHVRATLAAGPRQAGVGGPGHEADGRAGAAAEGGLRSRLERGHRCRVAASGLVRAGLAVAPLRDWELRGPTTAQCRRQRASSSSARLLPPGLAHRGSALRPQLHRAGGLTEHAARCQRGPRCGSRAPLAVQLR